MVKLRAPANANRRIDLVREASFEVLAGMRHGGHNHTPPCAWPLATSELPIMLTPNRDWGERKLVEEFQFGAWLEGSEVTTETPEAQSFLILKNLLCASVSLW